MRYLRQVNYYRRVNHMIEQRALSYVNMWGILGSLEKLCELDDTAKAYLKKMKKPISLCFSVKGGPVNTFHFSPNGCTITEGDIGCNRKMVFRSSEAFNRMISENKPGIPVKNIIGTLAFLAGPFSKLTERLSTVLQASEDDLQNDPKLLEENTMMTLYVLAGAIPALANHDSISKISAEGTVDGEVSLGIRDKAYVTVKVKNHKFSFVRKKAEKPRAIMEFADIGLAHGLFTGTVSTINEMCKGTLRLAGMLSMVDNINRILDRVSVYLA